MTVAVAPLKAATVLLTGFDAFGGDAVNPSWLAAQALHGREIAGHRVVAACLPTVFGDSLLRLESLLVAHRPSLVLSLGLAANRSALSIERVAINVDDARIPDNRGARPVDRPVAPAGPAAYFSSLPIKAMLQALQRADVPAEVSQTAGTFVCNHVFYGLMHLLAMQPRRRVVRAGFMHVPALPPAPGGMALPQMVRGLRIALEVALMQSIDARGVAAGAVA